MKTIFISLIAVAILAAGCSSNSPTGPSGSGGARGYWKLEYGSPAYGALTSVWIAPNGKRFFGSGNVLYTKLGNQWTTQVLPEASGQEYDGIWGTSATNVYAAGSAGLIYHYDGSSWKEMGSLAPAQLKGIFGFSSSDIYVVGDAGAMFHFDGSNWADLSTGTNQLNDIWGTNSSNLYAVGAGGTIFHYDGTAWHDQSGTTTANLQAVYGTSETDVYAAGRNGVVLKLNGTSWDDVSPGTGTNFEGVWASSPTNYFFSGGAAWWPAMTEPLGARISSTRESLAFGSSGSVRMTFRPVHRAGLK